MSSTQQQQQALASVEPTARDAAIRALEQRGVLRAPELVSLSTPIKVLGWCRWFDNQRGVRAALLVDRIKSGDEAPQIIEGAPIWAQPDYRERATRWLAANLPDVCDQDGTPHDAAAHRLFQLHFRFGVEAVTVEKHGAVIRAAVAECDAQDGASAKERQPVEIGGGAG